MAAAVFDSPRHHSRATNNANICSVPGCNSPKDIHNENVLPHTTSLNAAMKPFSSHALSSSSHLPMSTAALASSMSPTSIGYQHHSLPATLLQQSKSQQNKANYYNHYYTNSRQNKRKSAVELLAESKPLYVKSEAVLERQQNLGYRNPVSSSTPIQKPTSCLVSPTRAFHHQRTAEYLSRRSVSSSSDLLQNKLRKLLNDQGPNRSAPLSIFQQPIEPLESPTQFHRTDNLSVKFKNISQSPKRKNPEITIPSPPENNADIAAFFPSAFLSPQSLPPQNVLSDEDSAAYDNDDSLFLTGYQTISPPAEYAEVSSSNSNRYDGSNDRCDKCSHPPPVEFAGNDYLPSSYNINSHKSLPDLHSQSNRYSPHSDRLSGRGNRSIKSGSSFNHGSIGSSGHYTRKSEPCCQQVALKEPAKLEYFRDSGFSTQHSDDYNVFRYDFVADSHTDADAFCPLEFSTPEVPKAFQDDYVGESSPMKYPNDRQQSNGRSSTAAGAGYVGRQEMSTIKTTKIDNRNDLSPTEQELSPPLGTFKRQKCLRFKNRRSRCSSPSGRNCNYSERSDDRKPILRSKSDISDRYWNRKNAKPIRSSPSGSAKDKQQTHKNESFSELVQFFDQLGLSDQEYEECIGFESAASSPVFFSDSSTVDSNQLPDSTETQQTIQPYRPPETTSIVERNARIIKWLCNCKKLRMAK